VIAETPVSRDRLTDVAYSPDGKAIAIAYRNGWIEYFALQHGADGNPLLKGRPLVLNAHRGEVMSVKFVNAETLATAGTDGLVRIWKLSDLTMRNLDLCDSKLNGLRLSPDGSLLLYAADGEFGVMQTNSGEVIFRRTDPATVYNSCPAWSPVGDRLAVRCESGVHILAPHGQSICSISADSPPTDVAFSPDGSLIAVISNTELKICDSARGEEVFRQSLSQRGFAVAFSHDGARLAYGQEAGKASILDFSQMRPSREFETGSDVDCIVFRPDDKLLATGHGDCTVRIWDVATGELQAELLGHERSVHNLDFSPDGHTLLSCSADGTVRLWSVLHGRPYGVLCGLERETGYDRCHLSLSSDGQLLAVGRRTLQKDFPDALLWEIQPISGN
jgi:WD40 repeat protein